MNDSAWIRLEQTKKSSSGLVLLGPFQQLVFLPTSQACPRKRNHAPPLFGWYTSDLRRKTTLGNSPSDFPHMPHHLGSLVFSRPCSPNAHLAGSSAIREGAAVSLRICELLGCTSCLCPVQVLKTGFTVPIFPFPTPLWVSATIPVLCSAQSAICEWIQVFSSISRWSRQQSSLRCKTYPRSFVHGGPVNWTNYWTMAKNDFYYLVHVWTILSNQSRG